MANGSREPGEYIQQWDLMDESGRKAPAGVYFVRLRSENQTLVKTVIVTR